MSEDKAGVGMKPRITIEAEPIDGRLSAWVSLREIIHDFGYEAEVRVWVEATDSMAEVHQKALSETATFLQRLLSHHLAAHAHTPDPE